MTLIIRRNSRNEHIAEAVWGKLVNTLIHQICLLLRPSNRYKSHVFSKFQVLKHTITLQKKKKLKRRMISGDLDIERLYEGHL